MINETEISLYQLNLMKHTIGFDRKKVKRGKYIAWRNYFGAGQKDIDHWEKLVIIGLAGKFSKFGNTCYYVTEKGAELLSGLLGVRIVEDKE